MLGALLAFLRQTLLRQDLGRILRQQAEVRELGALLREGGTGMPDRARQSSAFWSEVESGLGSEESELAVAVRQLRLALDDLEGLEGDALWAMATRHVDNDRRAGIVSRPRRREHANRDTSIAAGR